MNNAEIDVFVISYNRLTYLKLLLAWLEKAGFANIHIVDNDSTYLPLLDFLRQTKHSVHKMDKNYGHLVVWKSGKFDDILKNKRYIVTDCDVLPIKDCPFDVVNYFEEILQKYPQKTKVGFSLKINDLPDSNPSKESIINWEEQFWKKEIEKGIYNASIDTTFALYRPNIFPNEKRWWESIRTGYPYQARHLPWYGDVEIPLEERRFYEEHVNPESSFWSITDKAQLLKYNKQLSDELSEIYKSPKWKILSLIYLLFGKILNKEKYIAKGNSLNQEHMVSLQTDELKILQNKNKQLVLEKGRILKSAGWMLLDKIIKK